MDFIEWLHGTILGKLLLVGVLILSLQIPIHWIDELVSEREDNRRLAVEDVRESAGGVRMPRGPVLIVSYRGGRSGFFDPEQQNAQLHYTTLRPHTLEIRGTVTPFVRSRGIFDVLLYRASLRFHAVFDRPDPSDLGLQDEQILWDDVVLSVSGRDVPVAVTMGGQDVALEPDEDGGHFIAPAAASDTLVVSYQVVVSGSQQLVFWAADGVSSLELESAWPHPKFVGIHLPETHDVRRDGFGATWNLENRIRPQLERAGSPSANEALWFGVELIQPVDAYRMTRRAMKYQFLFTALTLGVLFLTEIFERLRVHPIQYLLVGCALTMFYLLILSLSEHLSFTVAYGIAASGVIGLVWSYARSVLDHAGRAAVIGCGLVLLYAFLFVLLALQDYSLLFGSVGLFLALALVMFFSRNVDWYEMGTPTTPGRAGGGRSSGTLSRE